MIEVITWADADPDPTSLQLTSWGTWLELDVVVNWDTW